MRNISKKQEIWSAYLNKLGRKKLDQKEKRVKVTHSADLVLT